nr:MAG TPA: NTP-PPase-like protein [Caudoviricetes sp.]
MNTKMNLEEKVQQWFVDRNLHEANPVKQFLKLMEESGELFEGIAKDKSELIYDALGDIQVVLIGFDQQIKNGAQISANQQEIELLLMVSSLGNIAQKLYSHVCHNETQMPLIKSDLMFLDGVISSVSLFNGTDADSCLQIAYDAIKDRKGKMIDGVFVKEEDLA